MKVTTQGMDALGMWLITDCVHPVGSALDPEKNSRVA